MEFNTLLEILLYPPLLRNNLKLKTIFYRKDLCHRGHDTNNLVEAQFLVIKDTVLNRTKEINVNGVIDKLTSGLEDHYKTKLINVANGSFGGVYSRRFKGMTKKKSDGCGSIYHSKVNSLK